MNEVAQQAFGDFQAGMKYREIAEKYGVSLSAVKSWAARYWKTGGCNQKEEKLQPERKKVATKRGGQPGNKNAVGHGGTGPPGNRNAETHGLFTKYLPDETLSIIQQMPRSPIDILWDQIQIAYAAIVRAQQIMYVKDREDKTTSRVQRKNGSNVIEAVSYTHLGEKENRPSCWHTATQEVNSLCGKDTTGSEENQWII